MDGKVLTIREPLDKEKKARLLKNFYCLVWRQKFLRATASFF